MSDSTAHLLTENGMIITACFVRARGREIHHDMAARLCLQKEISRHGSLIMLNMVYSSYHSNNADDHSGGGGNFSLPPCNPPPPIPPYRFASQFLPPGNSTRPPAGRPAGGPSEPRAYNCSHAPHPASVPYQDGCKQILRSHPV